MAEPLSILGGFAAVIQISQVVVGYIKAVKGAKEERQRLLFEIRYTTVLCENLKDKADVDADQWMPTLRILSQEESGPLGQFKKTLDRLQSKLKSGSKSKGRLDNIIVALKWPFEQDEFREILAHMERQKSLFNLAMTNDNHRLALAILHTTQDVAKTLDTIRLEQTQQGQASHILGENIKSIQDSIGLETLRLRDRENHDSRQLMLSKLTSVDFEATHTDISSRRVEDTGRWLLESPAYKSWYDSKSSRVLWCPGKPGAGKTMLASLVMDDLRRSGFGPHSRVNDSAKQGVAGIYCSYRNPDTTSNLVGSILSQLLSSIEQPPHVDPPDILDRRRLHQIFSSIFDQYRRLYLVIDALDECADGPALLEHLRELLDLAERNTSAPDVHIFITGRHNVAHEFQRRFKSYGRLEISSDDEDVRKYLKQELRSQSQLLDWIIGDSDFENQIIDAIIARVDGMFLLARLYMDILVHLPTKRAVRKALKTLPESVNDTYTEAWNRVRAQRSQQAELGKRILLWVVHAERPLRVQELRYALGVEEGDEELDSEGLIDPAALTSFCAGLVIINEQRSLVSLVHPTTQEFFSERKADFFPHGQEEMAWVCVTYLRMKPFSEEGASQTFHAFRQRWTSNPFLGYAAVNWGLHVGKADTNRCMEISLSLLNDEKVRLAASQALALNVIGQTDRGTEWPSEHEFERAETPDRVVVQGPLHLAAVLGLVQIAHALLQQGIEVDERDEDEGTALHWALVAKQFDMVVFLLDHGADVNAERNPRYGSRRWGEIAFLTTLPLSIAADQGDIKAMDALIKKGAEIDQKEEKNFQRTALGYAISATNGEAAQFLLDHGANVHSASEGLVWAARAGTLELLKMLVEHGAEKHLIQEALTAAASVGHYEKMKFLLVCGANADGPVNQDGSRIIIATPLVASIPWWFPDPSNNNYDACSSLLLDNGACPNRISSRDYFIGDEHGYDLPRGRITTALLTASYFGRQDMIRTLIERGAEVNLDLGGQNLALTHVLRAEGYEYLPSLDSTSSSLRTRATLQLLISLGADKTLCTSQDQDRIDQLLNMSTEQLDAMANLQRVVWRYRTGRDLYHQKSFHDRRDELRTLIKQGADPTLCCTRDRKRIHEFLHWTDEEIDALDLEWNEERALRDEVENNSLRPTFEASSTFS
ncbi:MAG: hypothetical protein HETSPECPRED_001028 [Heterodermia speciosa]|uniref:NACHT domain-containing protein n=1 Tax=Heterodermia speciosa TaxID=116794 RepID=A0A8H3GDM8_9LECA|nr:MAG: hypothetical protein HETSPECPRED_001028 [Heterodermia speciosa]